VVTESSSKALAMAQTKHSTVGGNPDGHAQWDNYTGRPILPFSIFIFIFLKK
jgi:hypothetical protein